MTLAVGEVLRRSTAYLEGRGSPTPRLDAVHQVARELDEAGVPSPRVDAELLVAHVLRLSRTELYAADRPVGDEQLTRLRALVERRRALETAATA